jgi:hypothetical protein
MLLSLLLSIGLFFALMAGLEAGQQIGRRVNAAKEDVGTAAAEGVIFAVFGLIVAFTFSAAAARFNERRLLIVNQANALGTSSQRLDVLDPTDRTAIRQKMLQWTQSAQQLTADDSDDPAHAGTVAQTSALENDIWHLTTAAIERKQQPALWTFVMSPMNEWSDLSTRRRAENTLNMPPMIMATLIVLSLAASLLAGFRISGHSRKSLLHRIIFAGILAFLIFMIFDLNHPRSGLIQVGSADKSFVQVEQSLKAALSEK